MADLSKTVSIIFQGVNSTGPAINEVAGGLDRIGTEAGQAAPNITKVGDEAERLGDKGSGIDTLANSLKALATAVVVKEFIDANVEAERFGRAMTSLKGSSEEAGKEFEYIKGVANTLGLEINGAATAYIGFSAATKGTILEGAQTREIFEAVSKAMATLGKSSADTQGALNALGQMVSKGTVSMEELRQQLGDRLYGAFQTAAAGMGMTTQELNDLVSSGNLAATDFLPKFAAELRKTFGETEYTEGFIAANARMKNSLQELYQTIGESGAMEFLSARVKDVAYVIGVAKVEFEFVRDILSFMGNAAKNFDLKGFFLGPGSDEYERKLDALSEKIYGYPTGLNEAEAAAYKFITTFLTGLDKANPNIDLFRDRLAKAFENGTISAEQYQALQDSITSRAAGDWGQVTKAIEATGEAGVKSQKAIDAETKALNESLKALGIKPEQFTKPVDEIVKAFESLAANPSVRGDQFLTGLLVTLDKIQGNEAIAKVGASIEAAFKRGALTADEYKVALDALSQKQSGVFDKLPEYSQKVDANAAAMKRQKEEAEKAAEAAQKLALEYEKLASNERIKFMEFQVKLDMAQLEADTKKFEAIFDSIDNTVTATSKNIGDLFKTFSEGANTLTFSQLQKIEEQIAKENRTRDDQLGLQKKLTEAQIEEIRARTESLRKGNALIQVDGAGLQPHLEAFMFEILRALQVKVNSDGLEMLLGGTVTSS